jgi:hypothetical protein
MGLWFVVAVVVEVAIAVVVAIVVEVAVEVEVEVEVAVAVAVVVVVAVDSELRLRLQAEVACQDPVRNCICCPRPDFSSSQYEPCHHGPNPAVLFQTLGHDRH